MRKPCINIQGFLLSAFRKFYNWLMANYKKINILSSSEAAYIAGLIDGEGTISLTRKHRNENRQLVMSISNNERCLLEYVLNASGVGKITSKKTYQAQHKPGFAYSVSNRQALSLLEQVVNYLQSYKKARAELVLDKYVKLTPRNGKYSVELANKREQFIKTFFQLLQS